VAVSIQGERNLRVAQDLLDDLRVLSVGEHQGGEGVSQVVKPYHQQPCTPLQGLERAVEEVLGLNGVPLLVLL
jgi:hypothetical protein